jgi:hypothetical protein
LDCCSLGVCRFVCRRLRQIIPEARCFRLASIAFSAAESGNFAVLKWACMEQGTPVTGAMCCAAARGGELFCVVLPAAIVRLYGDWKFLSLSFSAFLLLDLIRYLSIFYHNCSSHVLISV